jgi:hypothetical protein
MTVHPAVRRAAFAAGLLLTLAAVPGAGRATGAPARDDPAVAIARALAAEVGATGLVRCTLRFGPAGPRPVTVAFIDPRLIDPRVGAAQAAHRRVRDGGVLELFGSPHQVAARQDQIAHQALQAQRFGFDEGGQPLRREHLLRSGPVLLRLSAELSDGAVRGYAVALDAAVSGARQHTTEPVQEAPCST